MVEFAQRARRRCGVDVVTFNFLYTEQGRKIPDRAPALEACYRAVIDAVRANVDSARRALFIGGKSMGGRIATQVAAADSAAAARRPRAARLPAAPARQAGRAARQAPAGDCAGRCCSCRAARDAFGTPAELAPILGDAAAAAGRCTPSRRAIIVQVVEEGSGGAGAVYAEIQRVDRQLRTSAP